MTLIPEDAISKQRTYFVGADGFEEHEFPGKIFALYDPDHKAYFAVAQGDDSPIISRYYEIIAQHVQWRKTQAPQIE